MKRISPFGVIVGAVVDWVTTATFAIPMTIYVIQSRGLTRLPREQMSKVLSNILSSDLRLYAIQFTVGMACSVLGSYIAGVIAKRSQVLNGALSAILPMLIGVISMVRGTSTVPLWRAVVAYVATPLAGMFGGYLALRQARRSEAPA